MGRARVASAVGLAMLMALSTIGAPAAAQETVADPRQPSVENPHMHFWGTGDFSACWTHFDQNDSSGSSAEGYGERTFNEGQQVQVDFTCSMQDNFKQDMYLNPNGTIRLDLMVNVWSGDCGENDECTNLTLTLFKGSHEVAKKEYPAIDNNGNDEMVQWDLPVNETLSRWNKSNEEPRIQVEFSWPGYNGIDCLLPIVDCSGSFRFYYSDNPDNYTVEMNFPVVNMTEPGEGGEEGEGGLIGGVADSLPGFGLMTGVGSLAMAAVAASRLSREE